MYDGLWKDFEKKVREERKLVMRIGNPARRAKELALLDAWVREETEKLRILETINTSW